jgi:hypothetical protein
MTEDKKSLSTCGCCEVPEGLDPESITNRPGLSVLAYRVGNHGQFKAAMKNAIAKDRALDGLTVRDDKDFSIALLDAWAVTADVLSFYQERIANEGYLRTATERLSLLHQARLVGYQLNPGVAADTYLAFTLMDKPEPPPPVTIDTGTKVQSVPGPGEKAQTFETVEDIEARAQWNAIKARLTQPQQVHTNMNSIILDGTATNLKQGDIVMLLEDSDNKKAKKILKVTVDEDAKTTRIDFDLDSPGLSPSTFDDHPSLPPNGKISDFPEKVDLDKDVVEQIMAKTWKEDDLTALVKFQDWSSQDLVDNINEQVSELSSGEGSVFVFRQQAFPFGYNAVKMAEYKDNGTPKSPSEWSEWFMDEKEGKVYLDNAYDKILPGSYLVLQKPGESIESAKIFQIETVNVLSRTAYGISSKTTLLTLSPETRWWQPDPETFPYLPVEIKPLILERLDLSSGTFQFNPLDLQSLKLDLSDLDEVIFQFNPFYVQSPGIQGVDSQMMGQLMLLDRLSLIRGITIYTQNEQLVLAEVPIDQTVEGDTITLDGFYPGLKKDQIVILTGEREDLEGVYASEMRTLDKVIIAGGFTVITFDKALTYTYRRSTVTINANVASATHGETVSEILGSGDATQVFQVFTLRQTPLTYISASTASGTKTTLEVRVNDLLWEETDSFYGHGPDERIYITRLDNNGKTYVRFGDGITGTRLPTGQENVKATFRKGIGLGGLLKAGQLSTLMTRPYGVKEVTNPLASSGAADPETVDQARQNTPLTVLTLDRIVSLEDFEDFANAFTGIDKARADWVWAGEIRLVYITVAGAGGEQVDEDSPLYRNLVDAAKNYSNGLQSFCLGSYASISFYIKAKIRVDTQYIEETVITRVKDALEEAYSFEKRQLAQLVTKSEVLAIIQGVEGVAAVDLDELYLGGEDNLLNSYLTARPGRWDKELNRAAPAELLTLAPNGVTISLMEAKP